MRDLLWGVLLASAGVGVVFAAINYWNRSDTSDGSVGWENAPALALLVGSLLLMAGIVLIHRGWIAVL